MGGVWGDAVWRKMFECVLGPIFSLFFRSLCVSVSYVILMYLYTVTSTGTGGEGGDFRHSCSFL